MESPHGPGSVVSQGAGFYQRRSDLANGPLRPDNAYLSHPASRLTRSSYGRERQVLGHRPGVRLPRRGEVRGKRFRASDEAPFRPEQPKPRACPRRKQPRGCVKAREYAEKTDVSCPPVALTLALTRYAPFSGWFLPGMRHFRDGFYHCLRRALAPPAPCPGRAPQRRVAASGGRWWGERPRPGGCGSRRR